MKEFLIKNEGPAPKTQRELLNKALEASLDGFTEIEKPVIKKIIENADINDPNEQKIRDAALEKWWQEKYGISYRQSSKSTRHEHLRRDYGLPADREKAIDLQEQLFKAYGLEDEKEKSARIAKLKQVYIDEYPDRLEGIEALFEYRNFHLLQREINEGKQFKSKKERRDTYKSITEYQFLVTHFINLNSDNRELVINFWNAAALSAGLNMDSPEFRSFKKGIVSQVASYKIFTSLGYNPKLSHPKEDAFDKIDMWLESNSALQVKGYDRDKPMIVEANGISYPGVEISDEKDSAAKHFNTRHFHEFQRYQANIFRYNQANQEKPIIGYFMVIPYNQIDPDTGEPRSELIDYFKNELEK